jgi:hypothetical protein
VAVESRCSLVLVANRGYTKERENQMRVCEFDGTETMLSVCPTCNEYKGLATTEKPSIAGMTLLGTALDDVFALMEQARQFHQDEMSCANPDCECEDN